jgi:hypothetical protein
VSFERLPGRAAAVFLVACLAALSGAPASGKSDKKDKNKPPAAQLVDSGSFGIFVKGQRVATETFKIEQQNGASSIKSQFQEVAGANVPTQKSELDMTPSGELLRYEWSQASGASLSVAPSNDFLLEKMDSSGSGKPAEQPFLLPSTTAILDNNFFIHREVLAWRYLGAACHPEGGNLKCQQGPAQFGALVPQAHISISVRLQLVGKEKNTVRGVERELLRLNLTGEDFEWALWVDDRDQFKLIRVAISADNTEVVRD